MHRNSIHEIFEAISELNPNRDNRLFTAADGPFAGEKLLVTDGEAVMQTAENGFFDRHPEIVQMKETGLSDTIDGRVFSEQITGGRKLVICGAGHVGIAVARIGKMIGCDVTVIDDRKLYADQARQTGAFVICEDFRKALGQIAGDANTWFVIVTRGHKWDQMCLRDIAGKPHAYIGLMGSRRRVGFVMQTLKEEGVDEEVLSRVFTPIGLDIGAETPEEIAVSVMAEMIQVQSRRGSDSGWPKEILRAILEKNGGEPGHDRSILMTMISRKGSAPRKVGTKMLLLGDGYTTVGTIGGGCVEADVISHARRLLRNPESGTEVLQVSMTVDEADEEGMVCGGIVEILLEKI